MRLLKTKYVGFEEVRRTLLSRDYSLPDGMVILVEEHGLEEPVQLDPGETRAIRFRVTIPEDARPGTRWPLNLVAIGVDGVTAGGVTMILNIQEVE